ncbi:reverse transcriptase domain-containing protein [Tanacetum coccineum]
MRLRDLLRAHADVFAWTTSHITGVPRTLIIGEETFSTEHQLNVFNHTEPVKQKKRSLAPKRNEAVRTQVEELVEAGVLREVKYQTWVSNPIIVKKDDGKWKLRIDFTNIGRNMEVNTNDMVIKSEEEMLADIEETLGRLWAINLKLNPRKCSFGVEEGIYSSHLITKQGIRADPSKIPLEKRREGPPFHENPENLHEWKDGWTTKANEAFRRMKECLESLPTMVIPTKGEHEIEFKGRNSIKGHILADFLAETSPTEREEEKNGEAKRKEPEPEPEPENTWKLFTDGATSSDGSGAGLMLVNPEGKEYTYALRFEFETTNNEAEYEALIAGLHIAKEMQIQELAIFVDSQLVANQVKGLFKARQQTIKQEQNKKADALNKLASMTFSKLAKEVLVEVIQTKSVAEKEITDVVKEDEDSWMVPIQEYLKEEILPKDRQKARKLRIKAPLYRMIEERLYRRSYMSSWLRFRRPQIMGNNSQKARSLYSVRNSELFKHSRLSITLRKMGSASKAEYQGKMRPTWEGPYRVRKAYGDGAYKLETLSGEAIDRIIHKKRIKSLRKFYV